MCISIRTIKKKTKPTQEKYGRTLSQKYPLPIMRQLHDANQLG